MKNLSLFQPNISLFTKFNSVPAAILQKISKIITKKHNTHGFVFQQRIQNRGYYALKKHRLTAIADDAASAASSYQRKDYGYRPRTSRACNTREQPIMKAAVRKDTFLSSVTCHTELKASRMMRVRR